MLLTDSGLRARAGMSNKNGFVYRQGAATTDKGNCGAWLRGRAAFVSRVTIACLPGIVELVDKGWLWEIVRARTIS